MRSLYRVVQRSKVQVCRAALQGLEKRVPGLAANPGDAIPINRVAAMESGYLQAYEALFDLAFHARIEAHVRADQHGVLIEQPKRDRAISEYRRPFIPVSCGLRSGFADIDRRAQGTGRRHVVALIA